MTTSKDIVEAFKGLFCQNKPEEDGEGRGALASTQPCASSSPSINPRVGQVLVPALPLIAIQHDSNHREKDQEAPHVPALAGLTELAAVIETDEEAKQLIENVVDLNALISEISDLPKDPASQRPRGNSHGYETLIPGRDVVISGSSRCASRGGKRVEVCADMG